MHDSALHQSGGSTSRHSGPSKSAHSPSKSNDDSSTQAWLDECAINGVLDNVTGAYAHPSPNCTLDAARSSRCIAPASWRHPLWLHVAGDSTMRFFYAGLLSHFNGSEARAVGFPRHWLPTNDSCAAARVGWPNDGRNICYQRWRGRCTSAPCTLDVSGISSAGVRWRLTFDWWTSQRQPWVELAQPWLASNASNSTHDPMPTAIFVSMGVWEAQGPRKDKVTSAPDYTNIVLKGLEQVTAARNTARSKTAFVVLGNGGCRAAQMRWWTEIFTYNKAIWPRNTYEMLVHEGNALLRNYAVNTSRHVAHQPLLFLDRAPIMRGAPRLDESPCFHFHPYGALTDAHVALALEALCRLSTN